MNLNFTIGIASTVSLVLPVLLIAALKLIRQKSFLALFAYYLSVVIYNLLILKVIPAKPEVVYYWGLANNLIDTPLMLYFFLYFSPSMKFFRTLRYLIAFFILFEAITIGINGFNSTSVSIIMAPGILMIFSLSLRFFGKHAKLAIRHNKAMGKAMIASSLVFAYGCYALLYLMYYVFKIQIVDGKVSPEAVENTFLVYYIGTIFSSWVLAGGIYFESQRIHKLKELKITRRELNDIYRDSPKMATPTRFRAAMLDFDKEHWN